MGISRSTFLRAALAVIALSGAIAPARAAVPHSQIKDEAGWTSFAFTTNGSPMSLHLEAKGSGRKVGTGFAIYDASRRFIGFYAWMRIFHEARVFTSLDPGSVAPVTIDTEERSGTQRTATVLYHFSDPSATTNNRDLTPGTYYMVVWGLGEVDRWSWDLRAAEGLTMLALDEGTRTAFVLRDEFTGTADVSLVAGDPDFSVPPYYYGAGGGASVAVGRRAHMPVVDTLVGNFTQGTGVSDATITNGDGKVYACNPGCYFFAFEGPGVVLRGDVVTATLGKQASAAWCTNCSSTGAEIVLWGMDARLPSL